MTHFFNSILETTHNTPLLKLNHLMTHYNLKNNIFIKLDYLNPFGSIKDRVALAMIEAAEKDNIITPHKSILVEYSSGNTGISLAAMGSLKGYRVVIVMPETASAERKKIITLLGADLILLKKGASRLDGLKKVQELVQKNTDYIWLNQYENAANVHVHFQKTAAEIWRDLNGKIDVFITGIGTGGTITGVGKFLKEKNPSVQIIGVEPLDKLTHTIEGLQPINGTQDHFVPAVLDTTLLDKIVEITNQEAFEGAKDLIKFEKVFAGISAGANLAAVLNIDNQYQGKNIVIMAQDSASRYFSTALFNE